MNIMGKGIVKEDEIVLLFDEKCLFFSSSILLRVRSFCIVLIKFPYRTNYILKDRMKQILNS